MRWLIEFTIAVAASYAVISLLGLMCKAWYLLFMFGWNLL